VNGGEAAVKDLTSAKKFDAVDGNTQCACSRHNLVNDTADVSASYGPSEGYRPPQDDIASYLYLAIYPVKAN
jgi:hypothetical protein